MDANAGFTLALATEVIGLTDEKVCLVQAPMKEKKRCVRTNRIAYQKNDLCTN